MNSKRNQGFTLIELMVTLAIGVILMLVAVPSFITYKKMPSLRRRPTRFWQLLTPPGVSP